MSKKRVVWFLMAAFIFSMPSDQFAQKRQRARKKTPNTEVKASKTPTSKTTGKSNNRNSKPRTSAEAKKQQDAAQKEIQLTQEQIRQNNAEVSRSLTELGKLDIEIGKTQDKIKELNAQIGNLDKEITGLERDINKNEGDLAQLREEYLKAVKKMRVSKKNKSMLAFIFSSKNMSQAIRRMRYLKEFSAWRARQTDEINSKLTHLQQERESLTKATEERRSALTLQKNSNNQLAIQKNRQEELVAQLRQNGQALQQHLRQKQAEARELGNTVTQLIAEEQRRAAEEAKKREEERLAEELRKKSEEKNITNIPEKTEKKSSDKGAYADARKRTPRGSSTTKNQSENKNSSTYISSSNTNVGFEGMKGKLPYPSTGGFQITGRFGRQELVDLPGVEYDNPGIDAQSDSGASARAVFKGKVSGVYLLQGYNTVVIVNHGNYYTVYGNIMKPSVKTGDSVDAGSILGRLASDEENSGHTSIHFEVWKNREKLNPQDWLK